MGQVIVEFGLEIRVVAKTHVGLLQIVQGEAQGLRNEPAAVGAKVAAGIRQSGQVTELTH